MNQDTINQIKEELAPLADKLGQGAEFVYGTFVRQQIVEGAVRVIVPTIALVVVAVAMTKLIRWNLKRWTAAMEIFKSGPNSAYPSLYGPDAFNYWGGIVVVGGITSICAVAAWFACVPYGVMQLANPHYYAINQLLSSVRGG